MLAMRLYAALLSCAVVMPACATTSPVGTLRYKNQAIVWHINDRKDVPKKPEERQYARTLYHVDGFVVDRLTRKMSFRDPTRATNVNALDEVPDSTWFINRIGVRDMSVDELRRGPNVGGPPEQYKPWTITGGKTGGTAVGFLMKDSQGTKYLLKFDNRKGLEMETAVDVIVQRLLWACGYNVPEDSIVYFRREDLILAEDATTKDVFGNKSKLTLKDLEDGLSKVAVGPDGVYRGLTSKYLSGIPIGPFARGGVRPDDPNDLIPHEQRRELRGARAIFSWLDHGDLQEDNTLDMWAEDPDGTHYVMHYFIDFGKAMGVMGHVNNWDWVGYAHRVDFSYMVGSLLTFGLWDRPWENRTAPELLGVPLFEGDRFHPKDWKSNSPYWPFKDKDRFDAFWGAKILIRFTPEHIRAVVAEGKYSDPKAAAFITETLIKRQRKTAKYWFTQVNPLDRFEVKAGPNDYSLCFDDLMLHHQLEDKASVTRYYADAFDYDGEPTGWVRNMPPDANGRACLPGLKPGSRNEGYTIVRIQTSRGDERLPPTLVHLAINPDPGPDQGALRIIGLRRE